MWQDFSAALVESLNSLEDDLTEKEVREIKALNSWVNSWYLSVNHAIKCNPLGFSGWIRKFGSLQTEDETTDT